jgi:Domain of unknown function (DUF4460)
MQSCRVCACGAWRIQSLARRSLATRASEESKVPQLRRRMIPLIKLVHPDFFGQEDPTVKDTNEASLQKLNEIIDMCQSKLSEHAGAMITSRIRTKLANEYSLVFYQYRAVADATTSDTIAAGSNEEQQQQQQQQQPRKLRKFTCTLRFPRQLLLQDSPRLFSLHVDRELEKLLSAGGLSERAGYEAEAAADAASERLAQRVAAGEFKKTAAQLAAERMTVAEEMAAYHEHVQQTFSGRGGPQRAVEGMFPGVNTVHARAANDFLRSGRVLFSDGVSLANQARALRRLHRVLAANYTELLLSDAAVWDTTAIVLTADVQYGVRDSLHGNGRVLVAPAMFEATHMTQFLSEVMSGQFGGAPKRQQQRSEATSDSSEALREALKTAHTVT